MSNRQREIAQGEQRSTDDERPIGSQVAVCQPATEQGREVYQSDELAVKPAGSFLGPAQPTGCGVDEIQDEEPAHSVVREAFPQLRDEQRRKPRRIRYLGTSAS